MTPDERASSSLVAGEFPTRMARRRALQACDVRHAWLPDPHVTPPLLRRVEDELSRDGAGRTTLPATARKGRSGRWRWMAAAVAVMTVAAGALVAARLDDGGAGPGNAPAAALGRQHLVVLALARSGQVTGISMLASGGGPSQQVLAPSRLVLDVPGAGRVPLGQALASGGSAVGAALADALEVRVDATWVLDAAALAELVDAVGGVVVDVDVDVTAGPDAGSAVLVGAGPGQRLGGAQAAAYAQWIVGAEPEAARLARQQIVVEAVLGALPEAPASRQALIANLPGAPTGSQLAVVVATTGALRGEAAAGRLASVVLPVDDIDAGGESSSYGLDATAAAAMVRSRLAGAALPAPAGGRVRVLVQNGAGTPGLGGSARSRLVAAGFRFVGGGNVEGFGVSESLVLLPDGSATSRARGAAVAKALGLNASAMRVSDTAPTIAELVVLLGEDFNAGAAA